MMGEKGGGRNLYLSQPRREEFSTKPHGWGGVTGDYGVWCTYLPKGPWEKKAIR